MVKASMVLFIMSMFSGMAGAPKLPDSEQAQSVYRLLSPREYAGGATGFNAVLPDGTIVGVTNDHVCELGKDTGTLLAVPTYGQVQSLRILYRSPTTDICFIEPVDTVPEISTAGGNAKPGDEIGAIGHPKLKALALSMGIAGKEAKMDVLDFIITAEEDKAACTGPKRSVKDIMSGYFQACVVTVWGQKSSVYIEPGNSGSPVLDTQGKLVGVVFAAAGDGMGDIIPLSEVLKAHDDAQTHK